MQNQKNNSRHIRSIAGLVGIGSLVAAFGSGAAMGDLVYELQALEGEFAGSHISGFVTLSDAMAGTSVWNLAQAISFDFASDYGPGYTWDMSDLIVSNDVAFLGVIGDAVLRPTAVGGHPGYGPDWRMDTEPHTMPGSIALGLGADNGSPVWNLVELGGDGNLDYRTAMSPAGAPQWQLTLVPSPATGCLLLLGLACMKRRR